MNGEQHWIATCLVNDETSTDAELIALFVSEGVSPSDAEYYVAQRGRALKHSLDFKLKVKPKWVQVGDENECDCGACAADKKEAQLPKSEHITIPTKPKTIWDEGAEHSTEPLLICAPSFEDIKRMAGFTSDEDYGNRSAGLPATEETEDK